MKRALAVVLLLAVAGTATSGATYTGSSNNVQGLRAAADFGVTATMTDPTSPLRGPIAFAATASSTDGGSISQVVIQRSASGAGTWSDVCSDAVAPYACPPTTLPDGPYDFRARATNQNGYTKTSAVVSNRLVDNTGPSVAVDTLGGWFRAGVSLTATVADNAGGSGVATVRYEYKTTAGSTWTTACTGTSPSFSCAFGAAGLTTGTAYDLRAVATDVAGNPTTSSTIASQRFDNTAPSGSVADPGANIRASVPFTLTASDAHSGPASVRVQYSPAGTGSWSDACVDLTSPLTTCSWDTTTVAGGLYDLRAVVTDVAGNTFTTSRYAGRRVDNVVPLTTVSAPAAALSGTVALSATASDDASGVRDVRFQRSPAGADTWTDICTDSAAAYTCSFVTTGVSDALYDLRTIATDLAGNVSAASTHADRRIDNAVPTAADVQTADGGGTPGVIQTGDRMTLTYSEQIDPASVVAGWNGTGSQAVTIRIAHHNTGDRLLFYNAANTAVIPLATSPGVVLEADYVPSSDATFSGTLTQTGSTFTVTLGARTAGNVNATAPGASTMNWFPSTSARDFLAKACTNTQRQELGGADAEF